MVVSAVYRECQDVGAAARGTQRQDVGAAARGTAARGTIENVKMLEQRLEAPGYAPLSWSSSIRLERCSTGLESGLKHQIIKQSDTVE
jgi:hypothetical protein